MKKLALLLGLVLFAAACGSDSDETSTDPEPTAEATATEEPTAAADETATATEQPTEEPTEVPLTASFRGVTEDTITIGVSMLDFEALVSSGLSSQGWGDQQLVWETYIADLNANGGINGRMVEVVYDFYNPVGTVEAEAACLRLTEDTEVFAVLGGFVGPAAPANPCIVGTQETILVGGEQDTERLAQANAPWIQHLSLREDRLGVFLELLDVEGMLDGVSLAVVGGPEQEADFEAAPALLAEHGIDPVVVAFTEATSGDIPAEDANWEPIAERIRSEGADTVLLIGNTQGGVRNIARAGLDVQIWAAENSGLTNPGSTVAPQDLEGAITIGGVTETEAWDEPLVEECKAIFTAANPEIEFIGPADKADGIEQWFNPIMSYCRWLRLFTMIAIEAGPDLTQETFAAAAATFDQFALPGIPFASLGPDKFAASDSFRLQIFDTSISETGGLVPLTDLIDATP